MLSFFNIKKRDVITAIFAIAAFFILIPVLTYIFFAKDLTSKEGVMNRNDTGITLLDRNGKAFFTFYQGKNKAFIPISDIPKFAQQAVIATEDKDFYYHPGFSLKAIIRSVYLDLQSRDLAYGGSTITQQLVKNSLLHPRKDFLRKYQEVILATEIDRRFSKDEILEMYLNSVYFGEGAFGIEEASLTYFGKGAKDLGLAESAFLAGLLSSPARLSPISGDKDLSLIKQKQVLQKMLGQGYISEDQKSQAEKKILVFSSGDEELNSLAPHFALMVKDELLRRYGEDTVLRSGFRIKTTLDLDWQQYAEASLKRSVVRLSPNRVSNGAVVVMDPRNGEIRALVGSMDWFNNNFGKFNVTTALRSPGSAFKPVVYAKAFEEGIITPASVLNDQPITYTIKGSPPYSPKNFDRKFRGQVLVRRSLSNSLNVPSVEIMNKVGVLPVLDFAERVGITSLKDESDYGLSLVLGSGEVSLLELTNVYSTFANQGLYNSPTTILKIDNKLGETIFEYLPNPQPVITKEVAFLISSILSDSASRAETFGNALNISRPAAVKTGTAEDFKDAWTIGYTPSIVVGVWVGNNDGSPMDNIAGSLGAAPIWKALMEKFLEGTPVEKFEPPGGIVGVTICRSNGLRLKEATSAGYLEYFIKGSEPTKLCVLPKPSVPQIQSAEESEKNREKKEENPGRDKEEKDKQEDKKED